MDIYFKMSFRTHHHRTTNSHADWNRRKNFQLCRSEKWFNAIFRITV